MTTPQIPTEQRVLTAPATNTENQPYWEAAQEQRLLIKQCQDCGRPHFYPRAICPHCFSDNTHWKDSQGLGEIYSFSVMRRVPRPYAIAYVTLDEGVTMMSAIVDCDLDRLYIGQRVKAVFCPSDSTITVPAFTTI